MPRFLLLVLSALSFAGCISIRTAQELQTPQALQKQLMELQGVCSVNFVSYSGEVIG